MVKVVPKPIVVEAMLAADLLARPQEDWSGVPNAVHLACKRGRIQFSPGAVYLETMSGRRLIVEASDWLLCTDNGEVTAVPQALLSSATRCSPKSRQSRRLPNRGDEHEQRRKHE